MPSTYSPNKNYELQATGENQGTWGVLLNNNALSIIDLNFGGRLAVTVDSANVDLTSTQAQNVYITLTGTLTGNRDLTFPASDGGFYYILNSTSGAFSVTVKPLGGTGVVVPQGGLSRVFINPTATTAVHLGPPATATATAVLPISSDGTTLGTSGLPFSDLFLASGGVINWAAGNVTLTHSSGLLSLNSPLTISNFNPIITLTDTDTGSDALISGSSSLGALILGADTNNEVADSLIVFRVDGSDRAYLTLTGFLPGSNDLLTLGGATVSWSDLFLASGGVVNWNNGNVTITHSTNLLTFNSPLTLTSSTPNITLTDSDTGSDALISGSSSSGTLVLGADENDEVAGSTITFRLDGANHAYLTETAFLPGANNALALGSGGTSWSDLFLASGGIINWGNGAYTVTQSPGNLAFSGQITLGTALPVTSGGTASTTAATASATLLAGVSNSGSGNAVWSSVPSGFNTGYVLMRNTSGTLFWVEVRQ